MTANYQPCLFQKMQGNTNIMDSQEWGIYVKSIPFKVYPDMKDIPSRDWPDENGDDEFIPDTPVFKAYEMDCEFVYIGENGTANEKIRSFLQYLSSNGKFIIYDSYTKIGRKDVRYISYSENVLYRREGQNDIVVFTVKLKVNDPISNLYITE